MTIIMCTNGFIPGADPGEVESADSHLPSFFKLILYVMLAGPQACS